MKSLTCQLARLLPLALLLALFPGEALAEQEDPPFEFVAPEDFPPLASFESVEAFDEYVGDYMQRCFDAWSGGSAGAGCPTRADLWDRELNLAYKRLMKILQTEGKQKLKASQRKWMEFRDSTIEFNAYTLDRHFDEPGAMWATPRADAADEVVGGIVKARTLLLFRWEETLKNPVSGSF